MGSTIAQLAQAHGFKVLFSAADKARQPKAIELVKEINSKNERTTTETENERSHLSPIIAINDDAELNQADLILEACAEDLQLKKKVFQRLVTVIRPGTVIASNTSSLSISELGEDLAPGSALFGIHFFHPVDKMPLVEVIPAKDYDRNALAQIVGFISKFGKTPVIVKDSPCFLVNRLLTCYIVEATRIASEKIPLNWVEEAAVNFGMPMGPMALLDEVGLDIANMVATTLYSAFGERMTPPPELEQALNLGLIGKKTGVGIYTWDESGKKLGFDRRLTEKLGMTITDTKVEKEQSQALALRMILPMVDEAARCLDEKVIRRAREIDLALVMGLGFPPFRGGLLRFADAIGLPTVIEHLEQIYQKTPVRREVSPFIRKLVDENRGFYARAVDEI